MKLIERDGKQFVTWTQGDELERERFERCIDLEAREFFDILMGAYKRFRRDRTVAWQDAAVKIQTDTGLHSENLRYHFLTSEFEFLPLKKEEICEIMKTADMEDSL